MKLSQNRPKILPPQPPEVVERPRLIEFIQQNQDKKLILILGRAAQGKSTLATSYVSISDIPSAWVNLDQYDSDAGNLYSLLAKLRLKPTS